MITGQGNEQTAGTVDSVEIIITKTFHGNGTCQSANNRYSEHC